MKSKILIVEDDPAWSDLVKEILQNQGHQVSVVSGADAAIGKMTPVPPDLVILDINLKGMSGLQLCDWIRKNPPTAALPILMLTALKDVKDKVKGLTVGADDYLAKPFAKDELIVRVMALLRRTQPGAAHSSRLLAEGLVVDLDSHEVTVEGKRIELRPKEFELLALFLQKRGRVLRREFLAEAVWGKDLIVTSQTIAQHIKNLRHHLGPCAKYIETIETVGYKFSDE